MDIKFIEDLRNNILRNNNTNSILKELINIFMFNSHFYEILYLNDKDISLFINQDGINYLYQNNYKDFKFLKYKFLNNGFYINYIKILKNGKVENLNDLNDLKISEINYIKLDLSNTYNYYGLTNKICNSHKMYIIISDDKLKEYYKLYNKTNIEYFKTNDIIFQNNIKNFLYSKLDIFLDMNVNILQIINSKELVVHNCEDDEYKYFTFNDFEIRNLKIIKSNF